MSVSNWSKIIKKREEILEAMNTCTTYVYKLPDTNRQISVEEFDHDNQWYVGYHTMGIKGVQGFSSMNFNLSEFYALMEHVDEINAALAKNKNVGKKAGFTTRDRSGDEQMLVFGFTWWIGDEMFLKSYLQYNRESDCREAAEKAVDRSDPKLVGKPPLRLEVWSEFVDIWHPKKMIRWIFYVVVWGVIQQLARNGEKCPACVRMDRVLKNHRCLTTSGVSREVVERDVAAHLQKAMGMVSVQTLTKILEEARKRIGGSAVWAFVYAETFLEFAEPTECMVRDMCSFLMDEEYDAENVTVRKSIMSYLETFVFSKDSYGPTVSKVSRFASTNNNN